MKKVFIVTGDTEELIENAIKKIQTENQKTDYIAFPENKKHPQEWGGKLRETLKKKADVTYIISTFHEAVLNLVGYMICKEELNFNEAEVIIATKESDIKVNYDKEGYLDNFPIGYLNAFGN